MRIVTNIKVPVIGQNVYLYIRYLTLILQIS